MKSLILGSLLLTITSMASANVMIDVRNDTTDDCSLAINARVDKTKWITQGWYVFASGEEAPIIIKDINDVKNVYVYNDCKKTPYPSSVEVKKGWIKTNYKFVDDTPKDKTQGYEEVTFERLTQDKYQIQN